mmetsp:Transcript_2078/g.2935  ORF Transcript_2078/g.2935 Transcript_2078/m.2935 type:complete len:494 (+) Transcript_2078:75-1556(+)
MIRFTYNSIGISLLSLYAITSESAAYSVGDLSKQDIAGIWRLTSKNAFLPRFGPERLKSTEFPIKEFTVYPKKKSPNSILSQSKGGEEMLLVLSEDGKFTQYGEQNSAAKRQGESEYGDIGILKGTWAFMEGGTLILAAERTSLSSQESNPHDTILVGKVVTKSGSRLQDNPALLKRNENLYSATNNTLMSKEVDTNSHKADEKNEEKSFNTSSSASDNVDVYLSVPKGKVKVGKFFYPQKHPSFFEQPMFKPTTKDSFQLSQVLGTLNTKIEEDKPIEKFKKQDLMGKRYFLTSYPLDIERRKKKQRWSIKYNKYVDNKPKTKQEQAREENQKNAPLPIRTFEVELFANNTFTTITGLGDMTLRGKWWIIGNDRDQFWMQVWRFGFGRSVSGSTYSEGPGLTQKDEVTYWGKIYEVDVSQKEDSIEDDPTTWKGAKIEINGSVMQGWGLEPCSVARFTMVEKTEDEVDDDDDDDDDDDEDGIDNFEGWGEFQ